MRRQSPAWRRPFNPEVSLILLNLGCGGTKLPGYINVDNCELEKPDVLADLGERWPFPDNYADGAKCSHILEHLPGQVFFHFMQELHRVCKPGARVELALPWPTHDIFRNDPSHYRPVMPGTMILFSNRYVKLMAEKGICLTNFAARYNVDFDLDPKVRYKFDESADVDNVDVNSPEFQFKVRHLNNFVMEWQGTMTVVK